jgi:hypothetical protein
LLLRNVGLKAETRTVAAIRLRVPPPNRPQCNYGEPGSFIEQQAKTQKPNTNLGQTCGTSASRPSQVGFNNNRRKLMAEIPVEKKSSMTWLWVLLGLLLAALLLWWLLADDDDEAVDPAGVETMQVDTMTTDGLATDGVATQVAGGTITDMSMLLPTIPAEMVGRQVQLSNVQVLEPVSDAGFWIGESADRRIYAVLSEERTPQTATEGVADVNAGATANLTGTIRTRDEVLRGLAAGTDTDALPQGIDRFIVVDNYQVQGQN